MDKPTVVFVPGVWEGPTIFNHLTSTLSIQHAYPTKTIPLPTTGSSPPSLKTFPDDVRAVRDGVAELVSAGKKVVLVMHSAGGFTGSQAIEGLSAEERKRKGEEGGIVKLVYLTAALIPEGEKHPTDMPFMKVEDGHLLPVDPIPLFFNDIPLAEAERHLQSFTWQPANYLKHIHITYGAWKEIPSVYLFCEKDKVIPLEIQQGIAQMAGAETESCDAGHSVMLSQPERCVDVIRKAAGEML